MNVRMRMFMPVRVFVGMRMDSAIGMPVLVGVGMRVDVGMSAAASLRVRLPSPGHGILR